MPRSSRAPAAATSPRPSSSAVTRPTACSSQLGLASKVADQSHGLYSKAMQDQNTAQSLTDQADVAKAALEDLAEEARRPPRSRRRRRRMRLPRRSPSSRPTRPGSMPSSPPCSRIASTPRPSTPRASRPSGARVRAAAPGRSARRAGRARPAATSAAGSATGCPPCSGCSSYHAGADLAAGCNSPIFAAHSGTVIYAGRIGGYGNFIQIANNDGSGISTAYGHIVNGGTLVVNGQPVGVGQPIARVGSTGNSTGCHLHFEVRRNNIAQDPVAFMRSQGIELAN